MPRLFRSYDPLCVQELFAFPVTFSKGADSFCVGDSADLTAQILDIYGMDASTNRPGQIYARCVFSGLTFRITLWGDQRIADLKVHTFVLVRNATVKPSVIAYNKAHKFPPATHSIEFVLSTVATQLIMPIKWDSREHSSLNFSTCSVPLVADVFLWAGSSIFCC